ncbi:HutD family protein [Labrys okinawensis]|uniref:HutD/Ves family protein n=1 Tax=Labrys okinawensis TaxID=346911 RepID=UPI0039BD0DEF
MKLIRFADLTPKPWKNGGGTTTEIAVSPEGAGFDDFDWRLSVADVASDGPFSLFPDIDRTLTLIEGKGLVMAIDGREPTTLTPVSGPLSFPGDVPVTATLIDGPIRDFNVMTRRTRFSHEVTKHDLKAGTVEAKDGPLAVLLSLSSGTLHIDGAEMDLALGDVVFIDKAVTLAGTHKILIARLSRIP